MDLLTLNFIKLIDMSIAKKIFPCLIFICFNIILVSCGSSDKKKGYKVHSTKEYDNQTVNTVLLLNVISKDSTIEIARQIREESKSTNGFVCNFYQPGMELTFAWASVTYAFEASECNSKDRKGTGVKYELVLPDFKSVDELRALKADRFNRKNLIKEVPDIYAKVKYEIYQTDGKKDQGVFVTLYPSGGQKEVNFKIKQVDGIMKYIFDAPNVEGGFILEEHYMTVLEQESSTGGRSINY